MTEKLTVADRIRTMREFLSLTRRQMSEKTGIKQSRLVDMEHQKQRVMGQDIEKICQDYPEYADYISYGGPVRIGEHSGLFDRVRTRLMPDELWVRRDEDSFAEGLIGKVSRLDYYRENSKEEGTRSFAVAILKDMDTYCETGILIGSKEGEIEIDDKEGRKLRSLKPDSVHEIFVREGTKDKVYKTYEIWESDLIK